ncbi:UNVERIFIED_CONTAM: hypothetical protein PYX00_011687 [Menopon gallinae]|uniref:Methionine--tRNA ligase, cytoplasmic n=1 Tax=Menopon gallinae TaxID=328185 RepID=A0AAW2H873_9NEOP
MADEKKNRIVTSALPYVNNLPHLGNVVGCVLSSDVYSRFCRKVGHRVVHICGTDEFGTAIEMAALEAGKHPREICDTNHMLHKRIYDWFEIEFDYFGRTTESSHVENTAGFFKRMESRGFLEEQVGEQLYCETCAIFLADRYVGGTCPRCASADARGDQCDTCGAMFKPVELVRPACSICRGVPVLRQTKHIFFRLDLLKGQLGDFVRERMERWSHNAREITKEWVMKELHARCITRDLKFRWGVPVPREGFEEKVLYVWFDAPIGYVSFAKALLGEEYEEFVRSCELYQFMGKDNVAFHSILFPGICMASDTSNFLVDVISSTEYLLFDDKKFSKSRSVGISGSELLENAYGEASLWRYYLMKIRPESKDSSFTFADFRSSVTSDLINNIGNFCHRVLMYIRKRLDGVIRYTIADEDHAFISQADELYLAYLRHMEKIEIRKGVKSVLDMARLGNEYIQGRIGREARARDSSFCIAASLVLYIGHVLEPFTPSACKRLFSMLAVPASTYPKRFELLECGHVLGEAIKPLFVPFSDAELELMGSRH